MPDNSSPREDIIEKYTQKANSNYRSFDPSRPDGMSTRIDIAKGDSIIVDPDVGQGDGKCWKATKENLFRFQANGCAFVRHWTLETRKELAGIGARLTTPFGSALDMNLRSQPLKMPSFNLPWRVKLCPVALCFKSSEDATHKRIHVNAFGDDDFIVELKSAGIIPGRDCCLDKADADALRQANDVRVFELRRAGVLFRVFTFFVTPTDEDGVPQKADASVERVLRNFAKKVKDASGEKPNATFVVMGTPIGWDASLGTPTRRIDHFEIRATPPEKPFDAWRIASPSFLGAGKVYREFVYSLFPETSATRRQRIGDFLDNEFSGYSGATKSFSVTDVAKATGDHEELVAKTFDTLLKSGNKYKTILLDNGLCICMGSGGQTAIMKFWKASRYGREKKSMGAKFFYEICFGLLGSFYAVALVVAKIAQWLHWRLPASVIAVFFAVGIPVIKKNLDASGED